MKEIVCLDPGTAVRDVPTAFADHQLALAVLSVAFSEIGNVLHTKWNLTALAGVVHAIF